MQLPFRGHLYLQLLVSFRDGCAVLVIFLVFFMCSMLSVQLIAMFSSISPAYFVEFDYRKCLSISIMNTLSIFLLYEWLNHVMFLFLLDILILLGVNVSSVKTTLSLSAISDSTFASLNLYCHFMICGIITCKK